MGTGRPHPAVQIKCTRRPPDATCSLWCWTDSAQLLALRGREAGGDSQLALCWQRMFDVGVNRPQIFAVRQ
jgi:hypothetical protein